MPFDPNPGGTATHYDLVLIGKGYSIATYLLMADLSWAQRIAVLGGPDAWSKQLRGDGIVNHARFLVDPRFRERIRVNQETIDRATFLETNEAVFTAARDGLAANHPPAWTDATTRAVDPPAVEFGDRGLDGSEQFLVTAVTPRVTTTAAAIRRGITVTRDDRLAPGLDLAQGATLSVYDIAFKAYGDRGPDDLADPTTITAMKVVYGGGAGPHAVPAWARNYVGFAHETVNYAGNSSVVDLDTFMRVYGAVDIRNPKLAGQTVAVVGPNAGVDAAVAALEQGATLKWLIRGAPGTKPFWIPTRHYGADYPGGYTQLQEAANRAVINYQEDGIHSLTVTGEVAGPYTVDLSNTLNPVAVNPDAGSREVGRLDPSIFQPLAGQDRQISANIVVYAVSQDPSVTERIDGFYTRIGPRAVLDNTYNAVPVGNVRNAIPSSLVPIFDRNQRFGAPTATVLGLATRMAWNAMTGTFVDTVTQASDLLRGTRPAYTAFPTDRFRGLELVGAAVPAMRRSAVAVDEINQLLGPEAIGRGISNLAKVLRQQALVAPDQLGTLRSAIEASTGADFREQVSTMVGFQAASTNYEEAAATVRQATSDRELQEARARALGKTASLLLLALSPEARVAYRQMYAPRQAALRHALGEQAPSDADSFTFWLSSGERWMGFVSARVRLFLDGKGDYARLQQSAERSLGSVAETAPAIAWLQQHTAADYNGMDQTALAVLIATSYPHILPDAWEQITGRIIRQRGKASAWGYDQGQLLRISDWLARVDALSKPLMDARQKKQPLPEDAVKNLADFLLADPEPYQYVG